MQESVELRWNGGPKRAKARQIPDQVWNEFETDIREMYGEMTVEELASSMRRTHGFEATLRQYTARLELWGLKKYKTKKASFALGTVETGQETTPFEHHDTRQTTFDDVGADSKRRRSTPSTETYDTEDILSEMTTAKRLKTDPRPQLPHRVRSHTSSGGCYPMLVDAEPAKSSGAKGSSDPIDITRNHSLRSQSSNSLQNETFCPLSERIVESILTQPAPENQSFALSITLDFCSKVAKKIGSFRRPRYGPMLSFAIENRLKIIAEYLFASGKFEDAANLSSIIFVSEVLRGAFRDDFYTSPSLILCARSARSQFDCRFIQRILSEVVSRLRYRVTRPSAEQFLAHAFLANLFSRQRKHSESGHHLGQARSFANKLVDNGDLLHSHLSDVLVYVYYKRFCHLDHTFIPGYKDPFVATGSTSQKGPAISHSDFLGFCSAMKRQGFAVRDSHASTVTRYLRESLGWCQGVIAWQESCPEKLTSNSGESTTFVSLWQMWHGAFVPALAPSSWLIQAQEYLGVPLAEHLYVCSEVLEMTRVEDDNLITHYLRRLYERTEMPQEPVACVQEPWGLYERTKKPHESLGVAIRRLCEREDIQQQSSSNTVSKQPSLEKSSGPGQRPQSLAPTIAPSLRSADSSYRRLHEVSLAMKRHTRSIPQDHNASALPSPGLSISSYGSNFSMGQLSDMFEKSCSVSLSSATQGHHGPDPLRESEIMFVDSTTKVHLVGPGSPVRIPFIPPPLW
ncbi:hypothetical protein PFICI_11541 [Pestalotiopsis fici W106-1]|uniref:Clr5 domain-containing protein n=1 Tax=Pestalotiopsis fici (strain W106-1 / CGMCC3.15140) TaxID=1229662 RepID=W3WQR3_PESFW|nr:uncharacterized protein PFICI_11541 [Pestalotiopsis fici W106-1]ETS76154.1 hypothetical protein PFICI_11541 [Pestalotiopsis fici W106-1]